MSLPITEPLPPLRNKDWLLALGLALPFLLSPYAWAFGIPLAALALLGLLLLLSQMRQQHTILYEDQGLHVLIRCFLFLWIPMLFSAIDAVDATATWRAIGLYPACVLAGVGLMAVLRAQPIYRLVSVVLMFLTLFWSLDAILQAAWGRDLFGYPLNRLAGITGHASVYFSEPRDFGFYMGLLSGVTLITIWSAALNRLARLFLVPMMAAAVALAGDGAGWIMFLVAMVPYIWLVYVKNTRHPVLSGVFAYQIFGWILFGLWAWLDPVAHHEGVRKAIQQVSGQHHDLWQAAGNLALHHPLNGVGAAGFESAEKDHSLVLAALDVAKDNGPQQVVLQLLAETGLPGLIGFVLVWLAFWRLWKASSPLQRQLAAPWVVMLAVMWWPLNAHRSFYALEPAATGFFLMALAVASLTHKRGELK